MKRILIVEDDKKIARVLELELNHYGYEVDKAEDGESALDKYETFKPNLILLDIMIPQIDGIEVSKIIRENDKEVGIIMVTAMDQSRNKIEGLNSGADDYVTKPFDFPELKARIEALLRRKGVNIDSMKFSQGFEIFPQAHYVKIYDEEINLSKTEFDLLLYLAKNANIAVSKEKILEEVWGFDYEDANLNVVEVYINYLRKKLLTAGKKIKTVRGIGYSFRDE
jgi:DNA-binding response OmpR family regulator